MNVKSRKMIVVVDKVGESGVTGSHAPPRGVMAAETDRLLAGHQDDEDEDVTVNGDMELSMV